MLDKSRYSFFIGFVRQFAAALNDGDVDIADVLASLAASLDVLHANFGEDDGDSVGGLPPSVVDDDAPGDDTPLGAALARIAELERDAAAVDITRRRLVGGASTGDGMAVGRQRRRTAVLKGGKRGKK